MSRQRAFDSPSSMEKRMAAWTAALRLQQFGYAEISIEVSITIEFATAIVRDWEQRGKVRLVVAGRGNARKIYELVPQQEKRPEPQFGDEFDQMWMVMRKLWVFSPVDLMAHCAVPVLLEDARAYCRLLLAGGYLRVSVKAVHGKKEAIYRLINATGVQAPREKRARCIVDPNLGKITPLSGDLA